MRLLLGRAGFTIWWDATGKDKKQLGLAVPSVLTLRPPRQPGERSSDSRQRPEPELDPIAHLELIGPGKDDRRRLELQLSDSR